MNVLDKLMFDDLACQSMFEIAMNKSQLFIPYCKSNFTKNHEYFKPISVDLNAFA